MSVTLFKIVLILLLFNIAISLKVIFERASVTYIDPSYLESSKLYVTRFGRKSPYYLNFEGKNKHPWNNNVTFHFLFYEYLHNEYRRSFVEMHFKVCDLLSNEAYVGGMLKGVGLKCPVFGDYHLMNMSVPTENFPYLFPLEKARVEIFFNTTSSNIMMLKAETYVSFKK